MGLLNAKSAGSIRKFGGGFIALQEVNPDGSALSTPDTWHALGLIESTKVDFEKKGEQVVEDETGSDVAFLGGKLNLTMTTTCLQRDANTVNLLANTQDKFYKVYYFAGTTNNKNQEYLIPVAGIGGKVGLEYGANVTKIPITIQSLPVVSNSVTFGAPPSSIGGFTAPLDTASVATRQTAITGSTVNYASGTAWITNQGYELFETNVGS